MATHSSVLAWRIPWTEDPGGLQSMGSQESDMTQRLDHHHHHLWLCRGFITHGLFCSCNKWGYSSRSAWASRCGGFSCCGAQALWHAGFSSAADGLSSCGFQVQSVGSIVVPHRLSHSSVCGIFPDQGSNPCLLPWQADSYPLSHHRNRPNHLKVTPLIFFLFFFPCIFKDMIIIK